MRGETSPEAGGIMQEIGVDSIPSCNYTPEAEEAIIPTRRYVDGKVVKADIVLPPEELEDEYPEDDNY